MYEHVIGVREKVDEPKSGIFGTNTGMIQATVDHVLAKAWEQATRVAFTVYGLSVDEVTRRINNQEMIAYEIPKEHKSVYSNDLTRGFIGTMIDGELKLLAGFAIDF